MEIREAFSSMDYGVAPESASLALDWISGHGGSFGLFIGGQWRDGIEHFPSVNPCTGAEIARVTQASDVQVEEAVAAASEAFVSWSALAGHERAEYLYAISRALQRHSRLFAVLESLDNGKPIRESRDIDVPLAARHFLHHAGWATLCDREFGDYAPLGVCAQIIPWNFPLLMISWKIAPALAMGNTVVLKPAETTSLTALLFAELCEEVGLPPGVVNIVTGNGKVGAALANSAGVAKVAFTGSTEVGRVLRTLSAGSGKKLTLELGGKSAFVVFADADLDSAVEGLIDAIWFNQGQVCCAGSRLLVQETIYDAFVGKVKERMKTLRVGDALDKSTDIGAINSAEQLGRIRDLVDVGVREGAELFQASSTCPSDGWFYPPTLLTNVNATDTVAQQEIFGPVLVCMAFRTPCEAVALANNSVYGLACSIWSENVSLVHDVASRVQAGTVWINCTNSFDGSSGFGGFKESGYGREGGLEGLYQYVKPRVLHRDVPTYVSSFDESVSSADRTHKLFIGGKQVRPDGGYSISVRGEDVARGNRKDIRNAVEAAEKAFKEWGSSTAALRSQILYYLAENLEACSGAFAGAGVTEPEFRSGLLQIRLFAGLADKFDGLVHGVPIRGLVYTRNEPIGVVGAVLPDEPSFLSLCTVLGALVAMGNTVVALPSEANPLPACELYRVIEASDVPGGVVNLVTGLRSEIVPTLADHMAVGSVWSFAEGEWASDVERRSASNLKRTWVDRRPLDWLGIDPALFLREATQVKNVWVPYGA